MRCPGISRGSVYYQPAEVSAGDLALMRRLDELHLEHPHAGSRTLRDLLAAEGSKVGRRHVRTLMQQVGIGRSTSSSAALPPDAGTARSMFVERKEVGSPGDDSAANDLAPER
jgi:putative transposase